MSRITSHSDWRHRAIELFRLNLRRSMKEAQPTVCPVCGTTSIESASHAGSLDLYRCKKGHFFFDDPGELGYVETITETIQ